MTLLKAILLLRTRDLPPALYAVGRLGAGENVGIKRKGDVWEVFFNERGYADSVERFDDEEAAVARFLVLLDEHTRAYGNPGILPSPDTA